MQRRWNDLRLRTRLVLSMALVSSLLTGAALLVIRIRVVRHMDAQIAGQVQASLDSFQNFQSRSEALADSAAALVATVPSLEAAMSTDDPRTIQDPVADIAPMLAPGTILVLADREGRIVARYPQPGGLGASTVAALLRQSAGLQRTWWYGDGRLYEVFLHGIYSGGSAGGYQVGTLALGQEMDHSLAEQISRLAGGAVVFSYQGRPVVSSLSPAQERAFAASGLASSRGLSSGVRLDNDDYAVDSEQLAGSGATPVLTVLRSFAPTQEFLQSLNQLFLLLGIGALLIGALVVYVIAHAFTRPLSELVTGAQALERGDFSYPLTLTGQDEAGQLTAAFARMRGTLDQTQRDLLRAARMEAIGQLAGGIAHDFNNLITIINGFSEIMLGRAAEQDPNRRYLQQIIQAGTRASAVTRQLLVFSRKDSVQARAVEINPILSGLHKMLVMLVGEDVELRLEPGDGLGRVRMDPTHLEQMIVNFAANARDAMPRGGTLRLATANHELLQSDPARPDVVPGRYVELLVADTGTGMDSETQKRVFEPFFTTKEAGKGTGLGLATIYGIVTRCQGHIFIDSELGRGTEFRVLLPVDTSPAGEADAAPAELAHAARGAGTILLVEDESGLRAMVREVLEGAGYKVVEAANGVEALALAQRPGPLDVLLTDVVMPKMGGGELAAALLKLRPSTAVVFTSGYTGKALINYGVSETRPLFLPKPFSTAALLQKVREALESEACSPGVTVG